MSTKAPPVSPSLSTTVKESARITRWAGPAEAQRRAWIVGIEIDLADLAGIDAVVTDGRAARETGTGPSKLV